MTRVLFVDDEQHVVDALRRMLRPQRSEWDLAFVVDPFTALQILGDNPADVVVSDMRMPGMDGLEFLQAVKTHHPETIRIVLSGQFKQRESFELIGVAHQYLAKPCDPDLLKDVVARAIQLRSLLASESLLRVISGITSLPSIPGLYADLMTAVQAPNSSLADISDIIGDDPAMTAKVLQLVNSSFFGLRREVADTRQAVSLLGLDNIVALAMGAQVFTKMTRAADAGLSLENEHRAAMAVAAGARSIAAQEGVHNDEASAFYLAGMLHDAGKLVLASNFPRRYRRALPDDLEPGLDSKAEEAEFGASHASVGAYLLGLWGLPDAIIEAAAHHHAPSGSPIRRFDPLAAVHVARAVVDAGANPPTLDSEYLQAAGVFDRVDGWVETVRSILPQHAEPTADGEPA